MIAIDLYIYVFQLAEHRLLTFTNDLFNLLIDTDSFLYFRVGATFEMIRTEWREICISIDPEPGVAAPFKWKRERQGSGETERERGSVCASVG